MTFLDAHIPMYLIGAPHPNRVAARVQLEQLVAEGEKLVCDAEVLQEILQRYTGLRRMADMRDAWTLTVGLCDEIFPIRRDDVGRAAEIVQLPEVWSARAALHLAVMERRGLDRILSFDTDFDRWPAIMRLPHV